MVNDHLPKITLCYEAWRERAKYNGRLVRLARHRRNRNGEKAEKGIADEGRESGEDKKQIASQAGREQEASAQKLSANGFVKA